MRVYLLLLALYPLSSSEDQWVTIASGQIKAKSLYLKAEKCIELQDPELLARKGCYIESTITAPTHEAVVIYSYCKDGSANFNICNRLKHPIILEPITLNWRIVERRDK